MSQAKNESLNRTVTKSSGDLVDFELNKLKISLEKSKAKKEVVAEIINTIIDEYYDGITTKEIYQKAFALLRKKERHAAGRYKLKKAINELGPTGYPFEKYVAELFRFRGYEVEVGKIISGECVTHEMDVIAFNRKEKIIVECKFHTDPNRYSDVKVPMYIHSRFDDIKNEYQRSNEVPKRKMSGYIYTNTRFTKDAVQYGTCKSMNLVSWDFPRNGSLREQIDASGLYPVTCMTQLTIAEKQSLLSMDVVLTRDICQSTDLLKKIGIKTTKRFNAILNEANELCNSK
jgi:hypothetical protein